MTREEAIERLKNTAWLGSNNDRESTEEAVRMAIEALSAEPNEIVRCKDCKYYKAKQGGLPWGNSRRYCNRSVTLAMNPDDFCSFAERREP